MLKKKSICFVNSNSAWGGGEKWHLSAYSYFLSQNYQAYLVTNKNSKLFQEAKNLGQIPFEISISNTSFLNPFKILKLFFFFKKNETKTVVLNLPADLKIAGIAAKLAGVQNIVYRRGMPKKLKNSWLNRFLFRKILTHIVGNSNEIINSMTSGNESWFPTDKLVLIYNGVDTSQSYTEEKAPHRGDDVEVIIGNIGRLVEQKGQELLIDICHIIKNEGIKLKILIAGEGKLKKDLEKKIINENLQENIKLIGHITNISEFMKSIDIFVFTSRYEGSANALIEALHHEKPVVAFNISSNPEIIISGKNGYLATPFDTKEMSNMIINLIKNKKLQKKFVKAGSDLLREKFDLYKNLNILIDIHDGISQDQTTVE